MLQSPVPLERRCPRRWSLAAACGLLSLAVLAAGVTLRASAAPAPDQPKVEQPKPDQPKPDQPKADQPVQPPAVPDVQPPDFDDLFKNLDPDQAKMLREQMKLMREQMRRLQEMQRRQGFGPVLPINPGIGDLPLNPGFGNGLPLNPVAPASVGQGRLGAIVERPSDTLVDQLELPADQGLIIREVTPDSAAAKAGLKDHDILLEVDGKPVSSDPQEFRKTLADVKPNTPVDVVVMRKGRKETLKGLSLPEAKAEAPVPALPNFNPPAINPGFGPAVVPNFPNDNIVPGANGAFVTTFRNNDQFTTRSQDAGRFITLKGKVEDGKAKVSQITIQDPNGINRYDSVDKVPEQYRDQVKGLLEMSEKGSVKVDVKAP